MFEVNQRSFLANLDLMNLTKEVSELFEDFYSPKIFKGVQRAIRALLKKSLFMVILHYLVNLEMHS